MQKAFLYLAPQNSSHFLRLTPVKLGLETVLLDRVHFELLLWCMRRTGRFKVKCYSENAGSKGQNMSQHIQNGLSPSTKNKGLFWGSSATLLYIIYLYNKFFISIKQTTWVLRTQAGLLVEPVA